MFKMSFTRSQEDGRIKGSNRVGGRSLTVGGPSNYLPYEPSELLRMGFYKKDINLMAGNVKNEGTFLTAREFIGKTRIFGLTPVRSQANELCRYFFQFFTIS